MIFWLLACVPGIDLGRATTLGPGEIRWSTSSEFSAMSSGSRQNDNASLPWFSPGFGVRAGVAPDWELGGRIHAFGWPTYFGELSLQADVKRQLVRGPTNVAAGLVLGGAWPTLGTTPLGVYGATVPLYLGWDVGRSQILVSPRLSLWLEAAEGQRALVVPGAALGLGWAIPFGPIEVTPELISSFGAVGFDGEVAREDSYGAWGFEAGVSVAWVTKKAPQP